MDMKQRSKTRWVVNGDDNSKFFHGYVNINKRKNKIVALMINGKWSTGINKLKNEAFSFFQNKFSEQWVSRPKLVNPNIKFIDMMDAIRLEAPFSVDEVKKAVWACGGDKALGPDGLTFKFTKKYWG